MSGAPYLGRGTIVGRGTGSVASAPPSPAPTSLDDAAASAADQPRAPLRASTPTPHPAALVPGRLIGGRYELIGPLGGSRPGQSRSPDRGATQRAFRAHDLTLERDVAIKVLSDGADDAPLDPEQRAAILHEAQAAGRVVHPHVATVLDVVDEDGTIMMVTELVEGRVLSALLRDEGPFNVSDTVQIGIQMADALDALHRQRIVHGGLSLNSIVLSQDGIARLVDLDSADLGATTRELLHRQAGDATSTLAPEQLAGGAANVKTDVYALGVVLYALLTGAPPFAGADVAAQLAARLRVEPSEPSRLNPSVPPDLDHAILMALMRDPAQRLPSAAAFRDALRQIGQKSRVDTQVLRRPAALATAAAEDEARRRQVAVSFQAPPAPADASAMPRREPRRVAHGRGWSWPGVPGRMIWAGALVGIVALAVLAAVVSGLLGHQPGASGEQWATFAHPSCEWSNISTPPGICFGERPAGFRVRVLDRSGARWQVWDPTTQGPAYVDGDALTPA